MEGKIQSTAPVSFLSLLFLTFLILKLCGVIGWSWWWVTAPLWGGLAVIAGISLIAGLVFLIGFIWFKLNQKK